MGFYYFGIYIGYSLAFAIGNSISQVINWRWVFFISALMGVFMWCLCGVYVHFHVCVLVNMLIHNSSEFTTPSHLSQAWH